MRAFVYIKAAQRQRDTIPNILTVQAHRIEESVVVVETEQSFLPKLKELSKISEDGVIYFIEPFVRNERITPADKVYLAEAEQLPRVFLRTEFRKTLQDLNNNSEIEQINVLDYSGTKTAFDFFSEAQIPYSSKFVIAFPETSVRFSKFLTGDYPIFNYYDLYGMGELSESDEDSIEHIKILIRMLIKYLDLGFHLREDIYISEDEIWELNITIPEMDLFIRRYEIFPSVPDQREIWYLHFLTDGDYRQVLTIQLAKFVANFFRNNGDEKKRSESRWLKSSTYSAYL